MLGILCVFKGAVGQGCNTLGKSEYARAGRAGVVIVESKYTRVRYIGVVIIKSITNIVISRVEL